MSTGSTITRPPGGAYLIDLSLSILSCPLWKGQYGHKGPLSIFYSPFSTSDHLVIGKSAFSCLIEHENWIQPQEMDPRRFMPSWDYKSSTNQSRKGFFDGRVQGQKAEKRVQFSWRHPTNFAGLQGDRVTARTLSGVREPRPEHSSPLVESIITARTMVYPRELWSVRECATRPFESRSSNRSTHCTLNGVTPPI